MTAATVPTPRTVLDAAAWMCFCGSHGEELGRDAALGKWRHHYNARHGGTIRHDQLTAAVAAS